MFVIGDSRQSLYWDSRPLIYIGKELVDLLFEMNFSVQVYRSDSTFQTSGG